MDSKWIPLIVYIIVSIILFIFFNILLFKNNKRKTTSDWVIYIFGILNNIIIYFLFGYGLYLIILENDHTLSWYALIISILFPISYFFALSYFINSIIGKPLPRTILKIT